MSDTHQIIIEINPDGHITGEVKGISGPACGPLSKWLDQLGKVLEDKQTPDYHKQGHQGVKLTH